METTEEGQKEKIITLHSFDSLLLPCPQTPIQPSAAGEVTQWQSTGLACSGPGANPQHHAKQNKQHYEHSGNSFGKITKTLKGKSFNTNIKTGSISPRKYLSH